MAEKQLLDEQFVLKEMAYWKVPGLAIGAIQDGNIIHLQGYGSKNLTSNAPVTRQTTEIMSRSFVLCCNLMMVSFPCRMVRDRFGELARRNQDPLVRCPFGCDTILSLKPDTRHCTSLHRRRCYTRRADADVESQTSPHSLSIDSGSRRECRHRCSGKRNMV